MFNDFRNKIDENDKIIKNLNSIIRKADDIKKKMINLMQN